MGVSAFRLNTVLVGLAFCISSCAAPRSALWAQFSEVTVDVVARAGGAKEAESASGLPFSLSAAASETLVCRHHDPLFNSTAFSNVRVGAQGEDNLLQLNLLASGYVMIGLERCSASGSGQGSLYFTATGPLFETTATADVTMTGPQNPTFSESRWPGSAEGVTNSISRTYSAAVGSIAGGSEKVVVWTVGEPAGFPGTPYPAISLAPGEQLFTEPTPGDSAMDGGLRYQAPSVSAAISKGFDLTADGPNPFTAFRFPDVPAGAKDQFKLLFGSTIVTGSAGETVNLRQYAPDGLYAFKLRGDLTPFLTRDGAIPLGDPPPPLTFGLAFANPGIGSFTLKPVPEPAGWALGAAAFSLLLGSRLSSYRREAKWLSAR